MLNKIKKIRIRDIREFFWPLLEGEPPKQNESSVDIILLKLGEKQDNAARLLEISKDICEAEDKRLSTVEAKATTILGATGLIVVLIANFGKSLFFENSHNNSDKDFAVYLFSVVFAVSIIYFFRAVYFALKAISRRGYHRIGPSELISNFKYDNKWTYDTRIAAFILEKTQKNFSIVNEKVDYMVMSQEYFKRGILIILFVAIILSLKPFLPFLLDFFQAVHSKYLK